MRTKRTLDFDVVVIGSGAGGGTVAKELAPLCAAGARVALLEWGGRFRAEDNTREEIPMSRKYYFDGGGFQTRSRDMTLAFARAVGGSTTVYTGTSLVPRPELFDEWGVQGLTWRDLGPRYRKYVDENSVHLLPPGEVNENNRLFAQGCRRLGWEVTQFPVNVRGCVGLGTCNLGCARLCKQGTAVVQIPAAERQGVKVIPFCRVDRIDGHDVVAEVTPPEHGLPPSSLPPGPYRFRARRIVVAAGTMNSPVLLERSFGSELSPALGGYFTCHPALILAAAHEWPIENTVGHPKSYYCDRFLEKERFLLETCMYFPFTLAKSLGGFGADVERMMADFDRLQMILALAIDRPDPSNRVSAGEDGRPVADYRFSPEVIRSLVASVRAASRVFFAAGAERVHAPFAREFFLERRDAARIDELVTEAEFKPGKWAISAAHLMGTCRMGADPATSVTDSWGRVHGLPHVFVADASLFPASSEVNPYLTVMALADRVAEAVRADLGADRSAPQSVIQTEKGTVA
jgi:choline dehydrogenase-like flavoprotein